MTKFKIDMNIFSKYEKKETSRLFNPQDVKKVEKLEGIGPGISRSNNGGPLAHVLRVVCLVVATWLRKQAVLYKDLNITIFDYECRLSAISVLSINTNFLLIKKAISYLQWACPHADS